MKLHQFLTTVHLHFLETNFDINNFQEISSLVVAAVEKDILGSKV